MWRFLLVTQTTALPTEELLPPSYQASRINELTYWKNQRQIGARLLMGRGARRQEKNFTALEGPDWLQIILSPVQASDFAAGYDF